MESLSNILKVLFIRDSDEILRTIFNPESNKFADRIINSDDFAHRLTHICRYNTLDQARNEIDLLRDKWMLEGKEFYMLHFSHNATVFNALLHFSACRIRLKNGIPICNFDKLLSWDELTKVLGEDLFVTSYLAAREIAERRQPLNNFNWDICLQHDANDLNVILDKPLADVHAHLKGSSANFDISWICLMNHISNRSNEFAELERRKLTPVIQTEYKSTTSPLYAKVIKAAAIRLYLLGALNNFKGYSEKAEKTLQDIIDSNGETTFYLINDLQSLLDLISFIDEEKVGGKVQVADYAISEIGKTVISQISGERRFLYQNFKAIYLDRYNGKKAILSTLFYYYLVVKEELRKEINQVNNSLGFANFEEYQDRKSIFLWKHPFYEKLMVQMAISNYMDHKGCGSRYMEPRIAPKKNVEQLNNAICEQDKAIRNQTFTTDDTAKWNYDYVCHFIKVADQGMTSYSEELLKMLPRHKILRDKVKEQALAILELRTRHFNNSNRLVGIDAANSEIACRPEVFAHAFRFLRAHKYDMEGTYYPKLPDLGRTYHVGEDFYSIVDGLRAVDEVLRFFHFNNGDRFGHALVLGTDVKRYYESKYYCVNAKLQVIVDNLAWLYVNACKCGCSSAITLFLKENYRKSCNILYNNTRKPIPDIVDYYHAWLLRGDDPYLYKEIVADSTDEKERWKDAIDLVSNSVSLWESNGFNYGKGIADARNNSVSCKLYHDYHFDVNIKRNGDKAYLLKINREVREELMETILKVQDWLLCEVERRHIAIECNPSSNLKIGNFDRYDEHPITKFNNVRLLSTYKSHDICVSINTDDSGVFSTTLEREYSLMALALEKCRKEGFQNSPRTILAWMDSVREMGHEQKFNKSTRSNNSDDFSLDDIDKQAISYFRNKERDLVIKR